MLAGNPKTIADKRSALAVGSTISALLLLFGVVGAGAEYRHRTLAPALLVAPARGRLLSARIVAYALAGLIIGLVMTAVAFAIGLPLLSGQPGPEPARIDYLRAAGGGLLTIVLSTILGVGVGTLVGNQIAAVIGSLVWIFIIEPLSNLVGSISKFTIGQAATAIAGDTGGDAAVGRGSRGVAGGRCSSRLGGARRPPTRHRLSAGKVPVGARVMHA